MSYLGGTVPGGSEAWEKEYGQFVTQGLARLTQYQRMTILMSVGLITGIEISNRLSINVILPDMQGNVAASSDTISWVLILYNLGFLCSIALTAWLSRVFGTRRHFLLCILLYSVGAIGCFLSPHSLTTLLIARAVMGFGGGAFLVRTVILAGLMFPGHSRLIAVTWLYSELIVLQIAYPILMGAIDDAFHWNTAFLLDFPFLILGAILIWKFLPPGRLYRPKGNAGLDLWGAGFLISGLILFQIAMSRGERDLWFQSSLIDGCLAGATLFFVLFLWWDSRPENPDAVLHLHTMWRQVPLRASFSIMMILGAIMGAGLYVVPQYLRHVQDYNAAQTGQFISLYCGGLGVGLFFSLRFFIPRWGGRLSIVLGMLLLIGTCVTFLYIWTPDTPGIVLGPLLLLQGFSVAPVLVGASNVATSTAALADLSEVDTTYFFVRQLGNTLGVTAATVIFDHRMTFHSSRLVDTANRLDPTVQSTLSQYARLIARNTGGASNPAQGALQLLQGQILIQSQLLSYIDIYFCLAALCVFGIILLAIARLARVESRHRFHLW
jgi:MFS transporter, DHA2 family, multidrug resistance protein